VSAAILELAPSVPPAQAPTAAQSSRIETISDAAGFARLRGEWSDLLHASRSDTIFLSWEWLETWWTHLASSRPLEILAVRRGAELIALAPFTSNGNNLFGVETLSFLGTGRVGSDYLDVMVRPGAEDEAIQALAEHIVRVGASLDLRQLRIASSFASLLARELRQAGCLIRATRTHRCPVVDLGRRSWENYLGSLGAEHRYNFQRKLRRLEKLHEVKFERVESEDRRRDVLPILFELHRRRWNERGGSDGLAGSDILAFHEDLTHRALTRGWLRLFVLWLNGTPVATIYGFRYGSVFSFYQSGFDPAYRKLGVGTVAMGLAIKSALEEGATEFDMLHGEEPYKFHWAKRTVSLGRIRVFPMGPSGRFTWLGAIFFDLLRSAFRPLRRGLAQVISKAHDVFRGGTDAAPGS
jgi:CelD/BcsL family acetyltransferase involved in cellulose biosynthesis